MTHTQGIPPAAPTGTAGWDSCDSCQAPMDDRQRYCVACGTRRPQADDPVAQYFASASRRTRAAAQARSAPPPPQAGRSGIQTAVVLALLPLAAAIGVLVGRSADNSDELAEALKAQKAPVVNLGSGGTARASAGAGGAKKKASSSADGKVISRTRYGSARQLTDSKVTPAQIKESEQALDKIVKSKGKEYVDQQRGLPDQIVIP